MVHSVTMSDRIRAVKLDDARRIAEIYRPFVEERTTSFELVPPDAEEMERRIARVIETHPWIVHETADGTVAGYAYAVPFRSRAAYRWCAESSVYLDPAWNGRGIGRGLMETLVRLLRDLGFHEVVAGVTLPNPASVRLHESIGFDPVGVFPRSGWKNGNWHDVGFWTRPIRTGPPGSEPAPWPTHAGFSAPTIEGG